MVDQSYRSAFDNPYVALVIGAAVSLDVIALTFSSPNIFMADRRVWRRWALYNACWHAGLLIVYLVAIDLFSVAAQYLGWLLEDLARSLPNWLRALRQFFAWMSDKFRSHAIIYAAVFAMAYVWRQYSFKIVGVPTRPLIDEAPFFLRRLFKRKAAQIENKDSRWFWHLSSCLVAVDMLALAAVIKSGEKLIQFPNGFDRFEGDIHVLHDRLLSSLNWRFLVGTVLVTFAVFVVVGLFCYLSTIMSRKFWTIPTSERSAELSGIVVVFLLKLLEPLIIFYFIIHSMAFLATGVPLHSPAFLLGSAFLVAALIQFVGFNRIVDAARMQAAAVWNSDRTSSGLDTPAGEPADA